MSKWRLAAKVKALYLYLSTSNTGSKKKDANKFLHGRLGVWEKLSEEASHTLHIHTYMLPPQHLPEACAHERGQVLPHPELCHPAPAGPSFSPGLCRVSPCSAPEPPAVRVPLPATMVLLPATMSWMDVLSSLKLCLGAWLLEESIRFIYLLIYFGTEVKGETKGLRTAGDLLAASFSRFMMGVSVSEMNQARREMPSFQPTQIQGTKPRAYKQVWS